MCVGVWMFVYVCLYLFVGRSGVLLDIEIGMVMFGSRSGDLGPIRRSRE